LERPGRTEGTDARSARHFRTVGAAGRLPSVRVGTPAQLRLDDGTTVPARVRKLYLRDDGRRVILELTAARPVPRGGGARSLQAALTVPASKSVVTVPARALQRTPSGAAVWIATPSPDSEEKTAWTAHRQPVQIGATRQGKAEIQAGLPPGSRVIVAGMERLREGQRVSVVPWSLP
jgi:membrane fusion protein (multidrug efflux system)